jgi:NTP pyrophosphatase (non-canonical NTP hydrolase)
MSKLHLKPNPTLGDIQTYVKDMGIERGFDQQSPMQAAILLGEEVGELFKVIRKHHAGIAIDARKTYQLDAAGEIADIIIVLSCIANRLGVDMEQAFREKEEHNKQRVWQ